MKLFISYMKEKRRLIILAIVFFFVFLLFFALYHLPVTAVIYPALFCFVIALIFIFLDYNHVKKTYTLLCRIKSMTDVIIEDLPKAEGLNEAQYQKIINIITTEYSFTQNYAKSQYLDMINYYTIWAHQIKTPIASMRLTLQNEDSSLSRKLSADLFRIEQYVEMVLMFLRLNSQSTDYLIKEYDLDTIIKYAIKKFSGEFINRKLKLIYEPLNTKVITDEKWLSFVIEQVLSNALKYTPSGSITINIKPDKKLYISDTGIGIAPEDLPRIFENGYTGYNGRFDKKASGIGLYLCKRICTNLGHIINAESEVDKGTSIIIDLAQAKLKVE